MMTNRDLPMNLWGSDVVIPAGTEVISIGHGLGADYAVLSVELLKRLTGNDHDPVYRYAFVPADAVGP